MEGLMDDSQHLVVETIVVGPLETNCYLVFDPKTHEGSVIDPGDDPEIILRRIKSLGLQIRNQILTHGHYDHIGALEQITQATDAEIFIHSFDAYLLKNPIANGSLLFGRNFNTPQADKQLNDGDVIPVGNQKMKVIHTPGHTRGSICLAGPGFILSGDTLFRNAVGRTDLPGSEPEKLIPSIVKCLMTFPDETSVYPGHGDATTIGHERKRNPYLAGTRADI
jgi:hydroxyacylglutathione hydrolase